MKTLLALLSLLSVAWSQEVCNCNAMIDTDEALIEVWDFPNFEVNSCFDAFQCASLCTDQWDTLTNNGDLDSMEAGTDTVWGQRMCDFTNAKGIPNVTSHFVFNYNKLCELPWEWDGRVSKQALCCVNGQYPGGCVL